MNYELRIMIHRFSRPYIPNLGSLSHPHVLEEALVVHQPDGFKKFLRVHNLTPALYRPSKFDPPRSSHVPEDRETTRRFIV